MSTYLQKKKKRERFEEPDRNNKNIKPEFKNKIWHWKIYLANDEEKETIKRIVLWIAQSTIEYTDCFSAEG